MQVAYGFDDAGDDEFFLLKGDYPTLESALKDAVNDASRSYKSRLLASGYRLWLGGIEKPKITEFLAPVNFLLNQIAERLETEVPEMENVGDTAFDWLVVSEEAEQELQEALNAALAAWAEKHDPLKFFRAVDTELFDAGSNRGI